jgi:hypothetical protein
MDYGQACRQTFICRITEGLPVIRLGPKTPIRLDKKESSYSYAETGSAGDPHAGSGFPLVSDPANGVTIKPTT